MDVTLPWQALTGKPVTHRLVFTLRTYTHLMPSSEDRTRKAVDRVPGAHEPSRVPSMWPDGLRPAGARTSPGLTALPRGCGGRCNEAMIARFAALVRRRPVVSFFALAYLLSWGWWVPIGVAGGVVRGGDPWPTHMPGLLGPLLAAVAVTAVTGGRAAVGAYLRRLCRWRADRRATLMAFSPLAMLAAGLVAILLIEQDVPPWPEYFVISGLPSSVLPMLAGLIVLNGFGEEGGWRGFAQEHLQRRHGPVRAAVITALAWAGWHAPLFVILASFRGFDPLVLPGFFLGMAAGAFVLAQVYNTAGGGVAAAACWHVTYNLASATAAASGTLAAITTTVVMVWAAILLVMAYRAARRRAPSPLLGGRSIRPDDVDDVFPVPRGRPPDAVPGGLGKGGG